MAGVGRVEKREVYPRERGGTSPLWIFPISFQGLSPRTRGNLAGAGGRPPVRGSIPANAGEPKRSPPATGACGVYPRERGGT